MFDVYITLSEIFYLASLSACLKSVFSYYLDKYNEGFVSHTDRTRR